MLLLKIQSGEEATYFTTIQLMIRSRTSSQKENKVHQQVSTVVTEREQISTLFLQVRCKKDSKQKCPQEKMKLESQDKENNPPESWQVEKLMLAVNSHF